MKQEEEVPVPSDESISEGSDVEIEGDGAQENSRGGEQEGEAPLGSCKQHDWSEWYAQCPRWGAEWEQLMNPGPDFVWPQGIQVVEGKMFSEGKLCVPIPLQSEWIRLLHEQLGPRCFARIRAIIRGRFIWGDDFEAKHSVRG